MVRECNPQTLSELIQNVKDGKLKRFSIEERKTSGHQGEYFMDFELEENLPALKPEYCLNNAEVIAEFASMLEADQVKQFGMRFEINYDKSIPQDKPKPTCSISSSYKPAGQNMLAAQKLPKTFTVQEALVILENAIKTAKLEAITLPELTRKIKKEGTNKPSFKEVTITEALAAVRLVMVKK